MQKTNYDLSSIGYLDLSFNQGVLISTPLGILIETRYDNFTVINGCTTILCGQHGEVFMIYCCNIVLYSA